MLIEVTVRCIPIESGVNAGEGDLVVEIRKSIAWSQEPNPAVISQAALNAMQRVVTHIQKQAAKRRHDLQASLSYDTIEPEPSAAVTPEEMAKQER